MADVNSAIGHASQSEHSSAVGSPGDSTGKEVCTRTWYGFYTKVLRPPCESLAAASAQVMEEACDNSCIGYSQGTKSNGYADRRTLWTQASKVGFSVHKDKLVTKCNCDCSSLVDVCICIGSRMCDDVDNFAYTNFGTGGEVDELKRRGYKDVTNEVGTSSPKLLKRGDVLWKAGHTAIVLLNGSNIENQDYAMEGCTTTTESIAYAMGSLYEEQVEKYDATLKEVGYLDSSFEPSIQSSNIRLSVINYTNLLGNLFTQYIPENITNMFNVSDANYDGISNSNAKTIARLLSEYEGVTAGGAIGIIANIHHESTFRANAVGDRGTSFGICQWHYGRGDNMKAHCINYNGVSWDNNLSGQVDYLIHELKNSYKSTWEKVTTAPNTLEGAKSVAEYFCIHFEIPADKYNKAKDRAATAETYWNQIVLVQGSGGYV